jgi:hypothetical protein
MKKPIAKAWSGEAAFAIGALASIQLIAQLNRCPKDG